MKKCNKCGLLKSKSEFYPIKSNKDGLQGDCKDCSKRTRAGDKTYKVLYEDEKPECECGGKVCISPSESSAGQNLQNLVWMCVGCGKVLGAYRYRGPSPLEMLAAKYRDSYQESIGKEVCK